MIAITGVTKRALHYYDEIGLLSPVKNESHHRVYTQSDLIRLQKILLLRSMNTSIKRIIELMAMDEVELKDSLKDEVVILDEKIERLQKARKAVDQLIDGVPVLEIDELNHNLTRAISRRSQNKIW